MPRSISPLAFVFCLFLPASAFAAPLAHWPFEEPSGTTVIDTTGNGHDGLLVGGVERADGASGLGLRFPGAGDAVEVASFGPLGPLHQLSISVWARQLDRGDFTAIVDARDTPQDGYDLFFSNNGRLFMRVNTSILEGPTFIADDAWHHLVGVWDGMSLALYVDGTLDASTTIPVTTVDIAAPLLFGRHFENDARWESSGALDEVRIYDYALDAAEVLALFQGNATDTAAPLRSNDRPTGLLPAGTVEVTLGVDTDEDAECRWDDVPGTPYEVMPNVFATTGSQSHASVINGLSDGETHTFYLRCADAIGNANADDLAVEFTIDTVAPGEPGLIGQWSFEEQGAIALDTSGNGHDATLLGGAAFGPGQSGGGLDVSGNGDYAEVAASPLLDRPTALTLAAWVQHAPRADFTAVLDKRDSGTDGYDLFFTDTGRPFVRVNTATLAGTLDVTDGSWHHLAAVWDGFSLALYVDGVLDVSQPFAATTIDVNAPLLFGRHFQGNSQSSSQWESAGAIDEVRIYDRPLSPQEIAALTQITPDDQTPPLRSNAKPSGVLPPGTEAWVMVVDTGEAAHCRWSEVPGTPFGAMPHDFVTTGALNHATDVVGLVDGGAYTYAVRCIDAAGNANPDDLLVSFSVDTAGTSGSDLLAHWSFEENGGHLAFDVSGNGHDAALIGGPQWVVGPDGLALDLSGQSDGGEVAAGVLPGPHSALSVAAWIRHGSTSSFSSIVDQRDGVEDGYDLFLSDTGMAFARVNNATLVGTTPITDGTWHHLVATWNGAELRLYVDGQLDTLTATASAPIDVVSPLRLGRHFQLNSAFESAGTIDEVRLYNRALSTPEVAALAGSAGPRINLAPNFVDKHVVQRVGTTADLPLGGSYIGSPTAIEARLIYADSGAPISGFDWTVVDAAPTGGNWGGVLPGAPQGGWYRLELRFANDPAVSLEPTSRLGVGMVIAMLGQSSMAKLFTEITFDGDGDLGVASQDTPAALTQRYGYGGPRVSANNVGGYLRSPANPGTLHYGDVTGAAGIRFANQLALLLNLPVLLLDFAIDGTSILEWTDPQWSGRQTFDSGLATLGGDFELMVWFQGGADIASELPASVYLDRLNTLYDQIQAQLPAGRTLAWLEAIQGRGDYPQANDAAYDAIRKVQLEWPQQHPNVYPAGTAIDLHLAADSFHRGHGHFTASQYQIMADRYTAAILDFLSTPGYEGGVAGPHVADAVRVGNQITVSFSHDQGTALTLPDPAADIEGFEISGDGFATALRLGDGIVSARLSADSQSVVLHLATLPTGPIELRYLHGMNPFGHKASQAQRRANGNTVYDDFQYHPERSGLPVHPTTGNLIVSDGS